MGHTVRDDEAMEEASKAKYVRLCVEVNLAKPLIATFRMRRGIWRIEYEGIHLVCFHYGKYGHKDANYPAKEEEGDKLGRMENVYAVREEAPIHRSKVIEGFGPWMLVHRQRRKVRSTTKKDLCELENQGNKEANANQQPDFQGSRFNALANILEENQGVNDMEIARIPQMEADNSRVVERGSNIVARHKGCVKQNTSVDPVDMTTWSKGQQTSRIKGSTKETSSKPRGGL